MSPRFIDSYSRFKSERPTVVCLGNFDGLHRGHQRVIQTCLTEAKRHNRASVLFTFTPHPSKVLRPQADLKLILTPKERRELFQKLGIDFVLEQTFDKKFAALSAKQFVEEVLIAQLQTKCVIVGENFRFGQGAKGDVNFLKTYQKDFQLKHVDPILFGSETMSSTLTRKLISDGTVDVVNEILGYPYFVSGEIQQGDGRGTELGFSTANLGAEKDCLLKNGVYATVFEDIKTNTFFKSITNIGVNPTFSGTQLKIETHVLNFSDNLVGRSARVYFLERLRDEIKFASLEQLKSQIASDIATAEKIFHRRNLLHTSSGLWLSSFDNPDAALQSFDPFKIFENTNP